MVCRPVPTSFCIFQEIYPIMSFISIQNNIEIPKLVVKNIAEEIDISILTEFKPYKK